MDQLKYRNSTLLAQSIGRRNCFYGCYYHSIYVREYLEKLQVPQDTEYCKMLKPSQDIPSILGQDSNLTILQQLCTIRYIPVLPKYIGYKCTPGISRYIYCGSIATYSYVVIFFTKCLGTNSPNFVPLMFMLQLW